MHDTRSASDKGNLAIAGVVEGMRGKQAMLKDVLVQSNTIGRDCSMSCMIRVFVGSKLASSQVVRSLS
jgi:hypothetical protein